MNPFDIKSALLAKHAQHVVLVHFPIALFLAGVVFDVAAQRTNNAAFAAVAYYNVLTAAISTIPVLLTGLLAWQWALGGHKLKGVLLLHVLLACATTGLVWAVGWLHFRSARNPVDRLGRCRISVEVLAAFVVAMTAHLGGFLSGINGAS